MTRQEEREKVKHVKAFTITMLPIVFIHRGFGNKRCKILATRMRHVDNSDSFSLPYCGLTFSNLITWRRTCQQL